MKWNLLMLAGALLCVGGGLGCDLSAAVPACKTKQDCASGQTCVSGKCQKATGSSDAGDVLPLTDASVPQLGDAGIHCPEVNAPFTDTQETYTVPVGVSYMQIKAWGAGGNGEGQCGALDDSGLGGYSEGVFAVTPGDTLIIIVGKLGHADPTPSDLMHFGFGSQGGGGLSGVFHGPDLITENDASKAYVIAGGGGGAGVNKLGTTKCAPGGTGNHPDSGGQATMLGGKGLDSGVNGGGGGYVGGNGAPKNVAGTGGSGFVSPTALSQKVLYSEREAGQPPKTDDPDYDGVAGKGESNGHVVIHFTCTPPEPQ